MQIHMGFVAGMEVVVVIHTIHALVVSVTEVYSS